MQKRVDNALNKIPILLDLTKLRKKPKRKAKGKKRYKNTHGTWHRVKRNYRIRREIKQSKLH